MNEFIKEYEIHVEYWWFHADDESADLKEKLCQHAEERMEEMTKQGYVSGELVYDHINEDDNQITFKGWWTVEKKDLF